MLDLNDAFVVLTFFLLFMFSQYAFDRGVSLTDAVGVGHSDIKEGVLAIPPETPRSDI